MRMHKNFAWFCLLGVLFLGLSSGAVLVARTINEYSGACEKLNGFPGMLQSAGFVPIGNCKFIKGKCPGPKREQCVVNGKRGHCVEDVVNGHTVCVCVKDRASR